MPYRNILFFIFVLFTVGGCHPKRQNTATVSVTPKVEKETVKLPTRKRYNESPQRVNDILHTRLEVRFDWKKQHLLGEAQITIKPYFYATDSLTLQAKGFDIHEVALLNDGEKTLLKYQYDSLDLRIRLNETYTSADTYQVYIRYTAKPNEITQAGSSAITSAKGLYFINSDSTDKTKATQLWTQGETEANSCWFPTIDRPNERMTQEILMTVPDKFVTLSNGLLIRQQKNNDGTRTDHWKQNLSHAPYLAMMFAGDFAVVEDSWKRKDGSEIAVNYYLEKEYEPHARAIFGKTPRMISYFSELLGVEYPWEKYHQVIVRDFVSGAMENTTAVINGDFYYQTSRETIDGSNESTIAHELFHHWFGDLVTCESWANLPLNESFANYSQYLWDEHEYGRLEADKNGFDEMEGYMISSQQQGYEDMIRFDYKNKEDMFDAHSYNKGGRILHMLRTYVGDEAFFKSLKLYLTRHQFKSVEIHDLRLAFEEVTGQDLNWFFNQWFLDKGHPKVSYSHDWDEANKILSIRVEQQQNFENTPLYKLPIDIDIYTTESVERKRIWVEATKAVFSFPLAEKPSLVNMDATKTLLCKKTDEKQEEEWLFLLQRGPLYLDKKESIDQLKNSGNPSVQRELVNQLDHPFWHVKVMAMGALKKAVKQHAEEVEEKLRELAIRGEHPSVRANAIKHLNKYFEEDTALNEIYRTGLKDSSYQVMATALEILYEKDPKSALEKARIYQNEKSGTLQSAVAKIYADEGNPMDYDFFVTAIANASGFSKFGVLQSFSRYLVKQDNETMMRGSEVFSGVITSGGSWYLKLSGYQLLVNLENKFNDRAKEWQTKADSFEKEGKAAEAADALRESNAAKSYAAKVKKTLEELKSTETDSMVKQYLGRT